MLVLSISISDKPLNKANIKTRKERLTVNIMKKLFDLFKKERTVTATELVQLNRIQHNADTLTALYFPEILEEMKKKQKVLNFFKNLNTECN